MPTLDEVINNPKEHYRVLLALREVLDGTEAGPHRAQYLASWHEALEALWASKTWVITEDYPQAIRLDGVRIYPGLPNAPLSGGIWILEVPLVEHGMRAGLIHFDAADLVAAVGQVDERFPLPEWWFEADQVARPWRHKKGQV